jgi:hypothetical protein
MRIRKSIGTGTGIEIGIGIVIGIGIEIRIRIRIRIGIGIRIKTCSTLRSEYSRFKNSFCTAMSFKACTHGESTTYLL